MSDDALDLTRCPICGEPNDCSMATSDGAVDCWCYSAEISDDVLERVPADRRGLVCVCARCASDPSTSKLPQ